MNRLREYRKMLGVSQKMMAEMFDISQQMVSEIERGNREIPQNILDRMVNSTLLENTPLIQKSYPRNPNEINATLPQNDTENGVFSDFETSRKWEKWWWRTINKLCRGCTRECKQSNKVKVVVCPQYEAMNEPDQTEATG